MRLLWLADVLRDAGLTVLEVPGWQTRSAAEDVDASTYVPRGVIVHETRTGRIASDAAEIGVLVNGRVGLSGPIAQLYLGRDGHWHVVAAGLCHHVRTGWGGPFVGLGNSRLLGVEPAHTVAVDAAGRRLETWAGKPVQYDSYVRGVAAILAHTGWPPPVGHREHQPGDKPDPEFNMAVFRIHVAAGRAPQSPQPLGDTMLGFVKSTDPALPQVYIGDGVTRRPVDGQDIVDIRFLAKEGWLGPLAKDGAVRAAANLDTFGALASMLVEVTVTDAQVDRIAARLIAATNVPLGEADKPAVVAAVKQALREGAAPTT